MNKKIIYGFAGAILIMSSNIQAQADKPYGDVSFATKFSIADTFGAYAGVEGYKNIYPNVYLGGAIGYTNYSELFGIDLSMMPIELNMKYAHKLSNNFIFDIGAGVSYTRMAVTTRPFSFFGLDIPEITDSEWLPGGQLFLGLTYKAKWGFIGINALAHSMVDSADSTNPDADTPFVNSWRAGMHIGMRF